MTGLTANAHADQFIALGTTFGFASEFQFGAWTVNHANLIRIRRFVGATISFVNNSVSSISFSGGETALKFVCETPYNLVKHRDPMAVPIECPWQKMPGESRIWTPDFGLGSLSFANHCCKGVRILSEFSRTSQESLVSSSRYTCYGTPLAGFILWAIDLRGLKSIVNENVKGCSVLGVF